MKKIAMGVMFIISMMLAILVTGCGADNSFASIVDLELFASVPMMSDETITYSDVEDVGDGNYLIWAYDTDLSDYQNYQTVLEEAGFTKYVDNGEEGLEGYVYTAHYQKDELLVVLTYFSKLGDTMITACEGAQLSERLIYKDEYVTDNIEGAQTTLTMPELYNAGNSFVFQLKNGHFIINDGGDENDLPYLLDYLESMVPEGEKPIIDAWIITHSHIDHMGVFVSLYNNQSWSERFYVEEVYFTEANAVAHEERGGTARPSSLTIYTNTVPSIMKSTNGSAPEVYRLREGERYYFSDITMDVIYSQDMLYYEEWKTWNASSSVLMYTIEGQKVLMTADTDYECQMLMLDIFDDAYFDLTVYQAPHHGGNVYTEFSSHLSVDSVIYPSPDLERSISALLGRYRQNTFLKALADEAVNWTDGGIVLTFPYKVGTYERLPLIDWVHHDELPPRLQK